MFFKMQQQNTPWNSSVSQQHQLQLLVLRHASEDQGGASSPNPPPAAPPAPPAAPSSGSGGGGGRSGGGDIKFPSRLHYVLGELEKDGLADIMSWQPCGMVFKIHDKDRLVKEVLPK